MISVQKTAIRCYLRGKIQIGDELAGKWSVGNLPSRCIPISCQAINKGKKLS